MKILLICEFFPLGKELKFSGGVEARTFFIAKQLAKKHKVTVITSRLPGSQKKENMFGFEVLRIGKVRSYLPTAGGVISRIMFVKNAIETGSVQEADIVEGSNFITHFIAKRIAQRLNIPVVFWYPDVWIGFWIRNTGMAGIFGEILERLNLYLGANAYIAISKQTELKLKRFVNNEINVIPCGIDKKEFKFNIAKKTSPTIICVSRLAKYKNIKTLILAFAYLTSKVKNMNLIIVGNGPQKNSLKKLSKALNIAGKVKFYSNLSRQDLLILYKSSHIFSLPSKIEGFGIATIEAAASGLPYVNSDTEIQKEVTNHSKGGFLVNSDSPLLFAEKIEDLIINKDLYKHKSKEAENLAKNYDWEVISRQTEKVYLSQL